MTSSSLGLRLDIGRVWQQQATRLTPARRRVLAAMADGETLSVVDRAYTLSSGDEVGRSVVTVLVAEGWITRPLPPAPLFGLPAEPGTITALGRNRLTKGGR